MEINFYNRPSGEQLVVENKAIYEAMQEKAKEEFSFGLLLNINDYDWHNDFGRGQLLQVFADYEEAEKHREVYPCDRDDIESAESDRPVKVTIQKQAQAGMLKIVVAAADDPLFDIMHPAEINRIIPHPQ